MVEGKVSVVFHKLVFKEIKFLEMQNWSEIRTKLESQILTVLSL